jgi:hypothetical protein
VDAWQHVQPSRTKGPCGLTGPMVAGPLKRERHTRRAHPVRLLLPCDPIFTWSAAIARGITPDPIPNSEVKPRCADGTAGAARWESTAPPTLFVKRPCAPADAGAQGRFCVPPPAAATPRGRRPPGRAARTPSTLAPLPRTLRSPAAPATIGG